MSNGNERRQGPGPCPVCRSAMKRHYAPGDGQWYWVCVDQNTCHGYRTWNSENIITLAQSDELLDEHISSRSAT